MSTIYDNGQYLENNVTWHAEDSVWKAKKIIKILEENNVQFNNMAEVGCGAGQILACLAKNYVDKSFDGYEISPQAFNMTSNITGDNINFYLQDFIASTTNHYDIVLLSDVFEHVENPYAFLKAIKNKTNYAVFHIPLSANSLNILRNGFVWEKKQWGHLHFYSKDIALELLNDTGFNIIDYRYTNFAFELSRARGDLLINLGRRFFNLFSKDLSVRIFGGSSLLVLAT